MLSLPEYKRYGRQMILHQFGLPAQLKLKSSSVLVVGAGGLGCPALQYLAAAGVGRIGIMDHDVVELSNLQRQILHTESRIGIPKADSAAQALKEINSSIDLDVHTTALSPSNALATLSPYDVILDCTDNAPTRYLLSDTAVALGKPLVSGAAQKYDGQLSTYNLNNTGPCYRCLFPKPPAHELVGTCEETGILGAVTGTIGNLQALEAIKIITGLHDGIPSLLIFSALASPPFRSIKLRSRRPTCPACFPSTSIPPIQQTDYVAFCGGLTPNWYANGLVQGDEGMRIRAKELKDVLEQGRNIKIIDVRSEIEFGICHLPDSINIPLSILAADPSAILPSSSAGSDGLDSGPKAIYLVCRLGNDSQIAADAVRSSLDRGLHDSSNSLAQNCVIQDLIGGLNAWARDVDDTFPVY
ncbi:hypothetical protein JAAARDRAFT_33944 [Jaapia argillacea MUCL 33604]|uniref:Rhodanese domain-containing protein n=1 Tax=Jaapia argillacea MUCL 33604 TaxID=933084 RepID=A0A067Q6U3_9AGAM|nr:hypothetical protein JAAARDRAFT_33944 [Jaapia argillacea MUCL 33604]